MNLWPDLEDKAELTPLYIVTNLSHVHYIKDRLWANVSHKDNQIIATLKCDGQSVELLRLDNAKGYPCKIWFDGKCSKCFTPAQLIGDLAWAFNHDKTRDKIRQLVSGL